MFKEVLPVKIIELLGEYVDLVVDIADTFHDSLKLLNEIRTGEARKKLADTMKIESKADSIRRQIIDILEETRIDPGFKEDFFHLVKKIDSVADWIKEAARELLIIPYLETPQPIREGINNLAGKVVEAARATGEAIKRAMDGELRIAEELIAKVERLEEEADKANVENRGKLLDYADQIKPFTLAILLHDLNQDLEEAADACEDAVDYLRALIVSWSKREQT